ncbi:transposase [Clostridium estertheticum]|uniref:transposase n=1 Tax=Clostridium estertheticum TaxID=238834 RepID=UPI001CF5BCD0|nr:transposase [Clostridium estertheticum]MCB2309201.1 transposase [Clostridium estertheticum]MCB2347565.1 transposase [Clostridium estertheticum]MCB2352158.1 transposase [Clostridium estertheticum]WAG48379.1 transposase [Clostridium estertheticum]
MQREVSGKDSDVLKHISPVAWQHINLYGRYKFNIKSKSIDLDAIILELAKFKIVLND